MKDSKTQDNIEHMSSEEKYEVLNRIRELDIITDKDIEILRILSYDKGDEIRSDVADILGNSASLEAENILIRLLQDKGGLVRACSCESLYYSNSLEVLNLLIDIIKKDKTGLVRGYAATSIANILITTNKEKEKYIKFFELLIKKEKVKWVTINIYKALYALGESEYLFKLLDEIKNKYYIKRSLAVNLLLDVVTVDNRDLIASSLEEALKTEKNNVVKSIIRRALKDIYDECL